MPTAWLANVNEAGERLTAGPEVVPLLAPVPVSGIVCGLPAALSVIVTAPVRVPVAVGLNATLIVQPAPAATELPQVPPLANAKSPLTARLEIVSEALPELVSVTDCAVLVVPTV